MATPRPRLATGLLLGLLATMIVIALGAKRNAGHE